MFYHQVYAQILNQKVKNLIVCKSFEMADMVTKNTYGKTAFVVEATYYDCDINDTYKDEKFYDDKGNERHYKGTEAENISILQEENIMLKKQTSEDNETILDHEFRLMELEG